MADFVLSPRFENAFAAKARQNRRRSDIMDIVISIRYFFLERART